MNKTTMLKEFIVNPKQTGSIISSSRALVKKMIQNLAQDDQIIELGAGNGCITRQLHKVGCKNFHIYENNNAFHHELEKLTFLPKECIYSNAFSMDNNHEECSIDAVISSLPLVNFSYKERLELLIKAFKILKPNGKFVMFTYKFGIPLLREDLRKIGFFVEKKEIVWLNFPPATVISLQKRSDL